MRRRDSHLWPLSKASAACLRAAPPFPAVAGLWGKPTNINNVETFANVPQIYYQGLGLVRRDWYGKIQGYESLRMTGKINAYRVGGSADGYYDARNHL